MPADTLAATNRPDPAQTADRLLDAQVAWMLTQLSDDRIAQVVDRDIDTIWKAAADVRLDAVVTAEDVTRVVTRLLGAVPASTTASTMLAAWTDVVMQGPAEGFTLNELVSREHVDALLDELLTRQSTLENGMDRLADSQMMGVVASRFMGRIVMEAVEMNRSMAEKIPGVGSLLSFGSSAASKVASVADKPLQMMGDTAGKGAAFAVRRLNKVLLDTLADPTTKQAAMEVWDLLGAARVEELAQQAPAEDVHRLVELVQEIVIAGAPTAPVEAMVESFVASFFDVYGEYPATTLIEELGITRDEIADELKVVVPRIVAAGKADGTLAAALRERLAPFFASAEVAAILT